jgi:hypothetical protein
VDAPNPNPILSKLEVAERQLDTAIWLWFNKGDIVSINNLTGNSFGILDDLYHKRFKERPIPFKDEYMPDGMIPRVARDMMKAAQNFSKHARNDPDAVQEFKPAFVEDYLFCAVAALDTLTNSAQDVHGLRSFFSLRFGITHRSGFAAGTFEKLAETLDIDRLTKLSRTEFFQEIGGDFIGTPPRPDYE